MRAILFAALALGLALPAAAPADSVTGVCPDGSFFVVQDPEDAPCARAKLVDPADLPPIRPRLLDRPFTWYVDQQARDPDNPYNLVDAAQKIREARTAEPGTGPGVTRAAPVTTGETTPAPSVALAHGALPAIGQPELRDLVRLVEARQQIAEAELRIEDVRGLETLRILLAHSRAFESLVLDWFGYLPADRRVIAFVAAAPTGETEFAPNFFVVQGARTFRPDPADPRELGLLAGSPGRMPQGSVAVGYLVVPASFDPSAPMDLWWNDRSVAATLAPEL